MCANWCSRGGRQPAWLLGNMADDYAERDTTCVRESAEFRAQPIQPAASQDVFAKQHHRRQT